MKIVNATFLLLFLLFASCSNENENHKPSEKTASKHHLNIPENGIESLMEANSQKIIEGTNGSIVILIGNVTRKEADVTIKRDDKILEEKMIGENEKISFNYNETRYTIEIGNIKKPLIGEGKVEVTIK